LAVEQRQSRAARVALATERIQDRLTGLANRAQLLTAIRASIDSQSVFALLVLDLDRFKDVNDSLGHEIGDSLLQHVAGRLRQTLVGAALSIARLASDEFAILLPANDADGAGQMCEHILEALEPPVVLAEHRLSISASIGVAVFPRHGGDPETLLRHADAAMHAAKRSHRGFAVYTPDQEQRTAERLELVSELRQAILRDELRLHYQPKVDCHSGRAVGVEALVRWQHPRRGLLTPDRFIPVAEQTGLIGPLTRWVLEAAVRQAREWLDRGFERSLKIAVNLSSYDLQDPRLPGHVCELLERHAVPSDLLSLEITESALVADPAGALEVLSELASHGVDASLDDFGTGYSSLTYLQQLPVRELKIDGSFVRGLASGERDRAIVRSTIELGHRLGLSVVAEGVEDGATLDLLVDLGCDQAQGYYLSEPLPAEAIAEWVHRRETLESRRADAA
jgi:diguanylate cyclase (GGDEF)-like protein